jgi:small-conductance mechanosensitive channel
MAFAFTIPYMETLMGLPGGQPAAFVALLVILAILFQLVLSIALRILGFLVGKTKTTLDDRVLKALASYLPLIATVTSLWIALEAVYPGVAVFEGYSEFDIYVVVMLLILGFLLSSVADAFMLWYGLEIRSDKKKTRDKEVFPLVRNVVKVTIILVFTVFVLQRLGFETGAIITGLGVGGLAVALALQDTLSNFFAGIHILVDKPFREDDYIKLESGIEGSVKQIGWRTTRLITLAQNEIVVPNTKMAGSVLENYSTPHELSGVLYTIGVDYREDIDSVEKLITDTLHDVAKKMGIIDESTIWVRFDSFGDFSLDFKFGFLVRGYLNRFGVQKEIFRELFYRFRKNNINIPFPVRVVYPPPPTAEAKPGKAGPEKKEDKKGK